MQLARPFMQSNIVRAASAYWNTIQYSTSDASTTVLHHVTFKVTQGKPGLNITKQISMSVRSVHVLQCLITSV